MPEDEPDRMEGVDFSDINETLESISYPITAEEFVSEYGDRTVDRTNADPISIEELFAGAGEETFGSPEEIRQTMLTLMPAESVGRQGYSDRGGSAPEETDEGGQRGENETM